MGSTPTTKRSSGEDGPQSIPSGVTGFAFPPDPTGAVPVGPCGLAGLRTLPPRENGGNFDVKQLTKGSKLFLPVAVPGALFSTGDGHFAQGDGEVCVTAVEMGATAVVRFKLPQNITRDDAKAMFEKSAPNYRDLPGLVRKYYLFGDDQTGGGVYLWESRAAAERCYTDAWKQMIAQRYGTPPEIAFYDTSVIVDNSEASSAAA